MKRMLCVLLAVLFSLPVYTSETSARKDILVVGTTGRITELSPTNCYEWDTWHVFFRTCDGLVEYKPGTVELVPTLAQNWDVSDDGKVYTFYLRENVTFTDGTPFNAEAVKWSIERALRMDGPKGACFLIKDVLDRVEVLDDLTVQFILKEPDSTFLGRLTTVPALIQSPATTPEDSFARGKFAGTGPYRVIDYIPDVRIVYEAYPEYWGPKPQAKKVIESMYADATALRLAIETGEVDVAYRTLNPADIVDLEGKPGLKVMEGPSISIRFNVFNHQTSPFDNPLVRKAIACAVDREAIVNQVFEGLNSTLFTTVPPGLWSHKDVFERRNLSKAQELLRGAGYSEDNPLKITLWYTPEHYGTTEADVVVVEKASLEETGLVKVKVEALEWPEYTERMSKGMLGFYLLGWYPDYISPHNFLNPFLSTSGGKPLGVWFSDPEVDVKLREAQMTLDRKDRQRIYEDLQELNADRVIVLPLWSNRVQTFAVAKPNVQGIVLDETMRFRTELIWKE